MPGFLKINSVVRRRFVFVISTGTGSVVEALHAISCQLHTSFLTKGIYFVEISSDNRSMKRKLVVE